MYHEVVEKPVKKMLDCFAYKLMFIWRGVDFYINWYIRTQNSSISNTKKNVDSITNNRLKYSRQRHLQSIHVFNLFII